MAGRSGSVRGAAGAPARGEDLVTVTANAPVIPAERALSIARGPIAFWSAPARAAGGRRWSIAGWGEAARIEVQGEARFEEVARGAVRLLAGIEGSGEEAEDGAPGLRLLGGFAFVPGAQAAGDRAIAPPWGDFADASFTLPRWSYATDGERAILRAVVPRAEADAALREIDARCRELEAAGRAPGGAPPHAGRHVELVAPDAWRALVGDALASIRAGELEKVVTAAPSLFDADRDIAPAPLLARLGEGYPECARFAIQRGTGVFVGATPERLLGVRGRAVEADGLAGSAPRRAGGDASAAADLLASAKDRREHALVVDAIAAALRPACDELSVPEAPTVRTLRNVHHLWSPLTGTLARPLHVLELAGRLHPTPAVCGTPRAAAIRWIREREPAPRGWYAGGVGWLDAAGGGALWVGIRAGLIEGRRAFLYAGAGIVEGSEADAELAETRVKRRPMLAALGAPL